MPVVRLATFNVENLFARFKFNETVDPERAVVDGWNAEQQFFTINDEEGKQITALAIGGVKADIICLQEVESLDTLKRFRDQYLGGRQTYPYAVVMDGNDKRLIDVAVLSRYPVIHVRSYQHLWDEVKDEPIFSRDCLEVDVEIPGGATITLFVNHLKSMSPPEGGDPCRGREATRATREAQARAICKIVEDRFGDALETAYFAVLGDLNDYMETDDQGSPGIAALLDWNILENVLNRLPENERWTHFWRGNRNCGIDSVYRQLDYLLLSPALSAIAAKAPYVERRGQPLRARRYEGERFPNVGFDRPKASDHCALAIDLNF